MASRRLEKSLFRFIWRFSKRQQIIILLMTTLSFPILYMSLELPKWIVNDAIDGRDFPKEFLGFSLDQVPYLIALCVAFLILVILNNGIKYTLNIYKGVTGERMLRRLRYLLYQQILRFRLPHFRKVSSGEIIPMITAEVEDVGVFIGEAIATPAFQGGTLLVYIVFIFVQDPFLGAAAISLYPIQAYVIPKLQRRVIILTRERIKNVRRLSDRIGESVGGVVEIHANATSRWHLADLSDRLFTNYKLRLEIFKRKFMIKFLNNFMNQLPPFFFYSVGGYLVIKGQLSFGALVAVLAAYKDLASPWKELLNWYQTMANVTVKYETVVENFDPEDALPLERLEAEDDVEFPEGALKAQSVSVTAGGTSLDVTEVSLEVPQGQRLALYGSDGSGRSELLMALAGLLSPTAGRIEIGGRNIDALPETLLGKKLAYVGPDPFLFNDTIRGNVVYALRRMPLAEVDADVDERQFRAFEAKITGNSLHLVDAVWEDHTLAGLAAREELDDRLIEVFGVVGIGDDLYRLGLLARVDPEHEGPLVDRLLEARGKVAERIAGDEELRDLVRLWRIDEFNSSGSLAENVLFALPADPTVRLEQIPNDPRVVAILREVGLLDDLVAIGAEVADMMIELFSGIDPDNSLLGDYSFIAKDELPAFELRMRRYRSGGMAELSAADIAAFVGLAFRLVPDRHRLVDISDQRERRIIEARPDVQKRLKALDGAFVLFDRDSYIPTLTIEDNILFGKARVDRRGASERIDGFIRAHVAELGLREPISRAGLSFEVGVQGSRLSGRQRRRIGLARALIKRPRVLLMDSVFDDEAQLVPRIMRLADDDATMIVGTSVPDVARQFDMIGVMRESRMVDIGDWTRVKRYIVEADQDEATDEAPLMEVDAMQASA